MNAIFRVDASSSIGAGHVVRCLTLARELSVRGLRPLFVCRDEAHILPGLLEHTGFPCIRLATDAGARASTCQSEKSVHDLDAQEDARQTLDAIYPLRPQVLVVDHYALGIHWESILRPAVRCMLVIEDVPGRQHQCDALLDQNFLPEGREPYAGLVPEGALVLLGPEFALLREEFSRMRESTTPRSGRLKRVLVFFTSGDDSGETLKALRGIEMAGLSLQVDVVLGTNQSDFTEIKRICARKGWKVYRHVDFMHHLISEADLVIGSGGSSNWERCALGAPAIVAVLAENQQALALALNRYGAVVCIGRKELTTPERYRDELRSLTERSIHEMSVAALSLVDGRGARRVSEALIAMCASKGGLTEVNRV